jgi:flagellar motility protein MotE (MotC chaperone)
MTVYRIPHSVHSGLAGCIMLSLMHLPAASDTASAEDKEAVIGYCLNIADQAAETRMARQAEALKKLESEIDRKLSELEARRAELQGWVERQDQIQKAASDSIVQIYAEMEPEVAAAQIASVDTKLASSVLRQMKPKQASLILNEMKPEQAALLMKTIAAASKQEPGRK